MLSLFFCQFSELAVRRSHLHHPSSKSFSTATGNPEVFLSPESLVKNIVQPVFNAVAA